MCKYLKLAKRNGKYGYVDKNKKPVIPFVFDDAKEFNQHRTNVQKTADFISDFNIDLCLW